MCGLTSIVLFVLHISQCIQQEKVIAEIQTHLDSTQGSTTYDYDQVTLSYLIALNKIFETGLLSHKCVSDLDSSPMKNIESGFKFFEEWCDEALDSGRYTLLT